MQSKVRSSSRGRSIAIGALGVVVAVTTIAGGSAGAGLRGSSGADHIRGSRGPDLLHGRGGNDLLRGDAGNDRLYGDAGNDRLYGDAGNDRLYGDAGNDSLTGGPGRDRLFGERGNDRIYASADGAADVVDCGPGRDTAVLDRSDRARGCERVRRSARHPAGDTGGDASPPAGGPSEPSNAPPASRHTRPNIVFILTDDQRWDTAGPDVMPNLNEQVTARGLNFTEAYVTRSLCCPSRASMLTGQYAHNTGVLINTPDDLDGDGQPDGGFPAFDDTSTVATWLHGAGYRTGLVGKYLNKYGDDPWSELYVPPGWDSFRAFVGMPHYYDYTLNIDGEHLEEHPCPDYPERYENCDPGDYSTTVLTNNALDFIRASESDHTRPFFLWLAYIAPHAAAIPAPGDENAFAGLPLYRPPSFNESDVSDKPEWVQALAPLSEEEIGDEDEFQLQQRRTLLAVDRGIAGLVDELRREDELANTVFVYTSDNGLLWGEHRLHGKGPAYQESVRVPLAVAGPGVRAGATDLIAANIDLAPTFAELSGAQPASPIDGRSLVPVLTGQPAEWRSDLLVENWLSGGEFQGPTFRALHTAGYDYVEYNKTRERELYNLAEDPFELTSRDSDPAEAGRMKAFSDRLAVLGGCSGADCR